MMNQEERLREIMSAPEVPEALLPEKMQLQLEAVKKRKSIKKNQRILKWTAGLTACCMVTSGIGYLMYNQVKGKDFLLDQDAVRNGITESYMETAKDYKSVYRLLDAVKKQQNDYIENGMMVVEDAAIAEEAVEEKEDVAFTDAPTMNTATGAASEEHSETYDQETGVHEADMAQTDGRFIYTAEQYGSRVHITEVENGHILGESVLKLSEQFAIGCDISIHSMYLAADRLILLADVVSDYREIPSEMNKTYVLIYQTGDTPTLIGTYAQSGWLNDVRMMEDGTLYLISDYWWNCFADEEHQEEYLPCYYEDTVRLVAAPEQFLMPSDDMMNAGNFESSFTNIGSINVLSDTPSAPLDFYSLACFNGTLYCSQDNIYLSNGCTHANRNYTQVTKLSLHQGKIAPAAFTEVPGTVKNQFSMSEYQGYFRIAVTENAYRRQIGYGTITKRSNSLYVYDEQLEPVGAVQDFGKDETIQSVQFNGDMAYVVTYRQTDPLFAIDLTDPTNPQIRDAYKITGYSTYMQQWDATHLLGFGVNANESGIQSGYKLVMFDTTNPDDLAEVGYYAMTAHDLPFIDTSDQDYYLSSNAVWERKMLLIAPEKNIIGVPFALHEAETWGTTYGYEFFAYAEAEFQPLGAVIFSEEALFSRAIYIGDYIYALNEKECVAVSMKTMEQTDALLYEKLT